MNVKVLQFTFSKTHIPLKIAYALGTQRDKQCKANPWVPNANYILLAHVGACIGSMGARVGSGGFTFGPQGFFDFLCLF